MASYARFKCGSLLVWMLAMTALLPIACGGGGSSENTGNTGTSAVTFQVQWDRPGDYQAASLTDCGDVDTVRAYIYSDTGDLLGSGGPWSCADGSGVIEGVPANHYATIGVAGYGTDGTRLYYGQNESPVYLSPGTVDAGVITAGSFVPEPSSPASESLVAIDALTLQWNRLTGASGYRVAICIDGRFSESAILWQTDIADGEVTSATPDTTGWSEEYTYYWRVQAFYDEDQLGDPSETWLFNLGTVSVTSITVVDYGTAGAAVPGITTTVAYSYASMTYTQVQSGITIDQWSAEITGAEYFDLQDYILSYELLYQGDITTAEVACTGWGGMTISMVYGGTTYGFDIAGEVCDRTEWPSGVSTLVEMSEAMVESYQP